MCAGVVERFHQKQSPGFAVENLPRRTSQCIGIAGHRHTDPFAEIRISDRIGVAHKDQVRARPGGRRRRLEMLWHWFSGSRRRGIRRHWDCDELIRLRIIF